jgi:uncharacterized membrane protein YidH (DUF202 family)
MYIFCICILLAIEWVTRDTRENIIIIIIIALFVLVMFLYLKFVIRHSKIIKRYNKPKNSLKVILSFAVMVSVTKTVDVIKRFVIEYFCESLSIMDQKMA